jgi:hypothetical protein
MQVKVIAATRIPSLAKQPVGVESGASAVAAAKARPHWANKAKTV